MEESLEIFDIADFWLETMFHLVREVARDDPDVAEELRRSREDLLSRRETTLADQALAIILDAATRLSRRLVLMIENMQDLCGETGDDFAWQLRGVLQTEPQIMLVGTATVRFPELQSADKAFFEMFRFLDLKPLDTAACRRLWCAVSGEGAADRTIRPLEILTGGQPATARDRGAVRPPPVAGGAHGGAGHGRRRAHGVLSAATSMPWPRANGASTSP